MLGLLPGGVLGRMRTAETAALWQLYEQTNGANWTKNENWDLANDPCRLFRVRRPHVGDRYDVASEVMSGDEWYEPTPWYGVSCSGPCDDYLDGDACYHGRATALRLRQNGLRGDLDWTRMGEMADLNPSHNSDPVVVILTLTPTPTLFLTLTRRNGQPDARRPRVQPHRRCAADRLTLPLTLPLPLPLPLSLPSTLTRRAADRARPAQQCRVPPVLQLAALRRAADGAPAR